MALTELQGQELAPQRVVIEAGPVRVFAEAVGDDDPVYREPGAPVPPTFPFVMNYWGSDGRGGAGDLPIDRLRGPGRAILHGEQAFTFHDGRWPHVGDVLVGTGTITDVYEKERSSGGTLEFYVTERTWAHEATGEPVVTSRFTLTIVVRPSA